MLHKWHQTRIAGLVVAVRSRSSCAGRTRERTDGRATIAIVVGSFWFLDPHAPSSQCGVVTVSSATRRPRRSLPRRRVRAGSPLDPLPGATARVLKSYVNIPPSSQQAQNVSVVKGKDRLRKLDLAEVKSRAETASTKHSRSLRVSSRTCLAISQRPSTETDASDAARSVALAAQWILSPPRLFDAIVVDTLHRASRPQHNRRTCCGSANLPSHVVPCSDRLAWHRR